MAEGEPVPTNDLPKIDLAKEPRAWKDIERGIAPQARPSGRTEGELKEAKEKQAAGFRTLFGAAGEDQSPDQTPAQDTYERDVERGS